MSLLFEYVLLPILLYVSGLLCIRLLGKKALSEMTGLEIFAIFLVNDTIIGPIIQVHWLKSIYYSFLLTFFYLITISSKRRFPKFARVLSPASTVLIRNGDILEKGLKETKLSTTELLSILRAKGYLSPTNVEFAALEEIGQFSVIPKSTSRPIEAHDLGLQPSQTFIPLPLIMDGQVNEGNLHYLGFDMNWLTDQLISLGFSSKDYASITLATYDASGQLVVDSTT